MKPLILTILASVLLVIGCDSSPQSENQEQDNNQPPASTEISPTVVTTLNSDSGLARSQVAAVASCPNNDVWVGYGISGGGISRVTPAGISTITETVNGLASNYVRAIACDRNNHLWIGYGVNGNGLTKYDGQSWTHYSTAAGLSSNYVASIAVTESGQVWISYGTQRSGLDRFE